jgi:SAM-dependent methyltransferase
MRLTRPDSLDFGWDRGQPIDRYYVERFLQEHARDVRGRVLEIGDDAYSRRYGGDRVTVQEILHVHEGNPRATLIGDISEPGVLPPSTFDCIVLTQTLQLVYRLPEAMAQLHAALAPGGVLLVTVPGISQIDRGEWCDGWYWSLTAASLTRLLTSHFRPESVMIEQHGNVFAATAFLRGLAVREVETAALDVLDSAYPVVLTARAQKL